MKKSTKLISTLLFATFTLVLSGCSTIEVATYSSDMENVQTLKDSGVTFNVAPFTAKLNQHKSQCRVGANITTPDKEPFEKYIENAFISELKMAGVYSKDSSIVINGYLNDIDDSSMMGTAFWSFDIKISNAKGESFTVNHKRNYSASFIGGIACGSDMPEAFMPTVQELIKEIINNPKFSELFITNK